MRSLKTNFFLKSLPLAVIAYVILAGNSNSNFRPDFFPAGNTGANGSSTCSGCHSSFSPNTNGSVSSTLPSTISPNTAYNFSVTINSSQANRKRFGFAIKAIDETTGNSMGTFSTTNPNAVADADELGHKNVTISSTVLTTYTYNNLTWTAPTTIPSTGIKFYLVGVAGNGADGNSQDVPYQTSFLVTPATTLPVNLVNFNIQSKTNGALLTWQTAEERNNSGFEIEKSKDGKIFKTITFIKAKNQSKETNSYEFLDESPSQSVSYYRLKQIDSDGKNTYSKIISYLYKTNENVAYPNPSQDQISINNLAKNSFFEITSTTGRIYAVQSNNQAKLNIAHLPKGIYYLKVEKNKAIKIVKQ